MKKPYHHGSLKRVLIENGIELINRRGIDNFSLRQLALISGVSHTASYKHFPDKGSLIIAIQLHIEQILAERLQDALDRQKPGAEPLLLLAQAYLSFFRENPEYFTFLITRSEAVIDLDDKNFTGNYQPFEIFKKIAYEEMRRWGSPQKSRQKMLIGMWAAVHGLTSIASMKGVRYKGDWNELLIAIMKQTY
jgi:AcrR family transcriptional regulator